MALILLLQIEDSVVCFCCWNWIYFIVNNCQEWSGCTIRTLARICLLYYISPTPWFYGMQLQEQKSGRRHTPSTCSHFPSIRLNPQMWRVSTHASFSLKRINEKVLYFYVLFFTVRTSDCILFVNDFSLHRAPASNGRKFFISSSTGSTSTSMTNLTSIDRDNSFDESRPSSKSRSLRSHLSRILVGVDVKPK